MALRIIEELDPVFRPTIITTLFSPPSMGKTTAGYSANKPLLMDFDGGVSRALGRNGRTIQFDSWADMLYVQREPQKYLADAETVVIDTAGAAIDLMAQQVILEDVKWSTRGGSLSQNGYGELKNRFITWLNFLRGLGVDIVLIAHAEEKQRGDDTVDRLDIAGGSKQVIHKVSDLMGRLYMEQGQRKLNFSPSDSAYGKNPAQFDIIDVPSVEDDPKFLAGIIRECKMRMNSRTEKDAAYAKLMLAWQDKIRAASSPSEFTDFLKPAKGKKEADIDENVKRMIWGASKKLGFTWDAIEKGFINNNKKDAK